MVLLNILLVPFLVLMLLALVVVIGSMDLVSGSSTGQANSGVDLANLYEPYLSETDSCKYAVGDVDDEPNQATNKTSSPHTTSSFPTPSSQLDFDVSSIYIVNI